MICLAAYHTGLITLELVPEPVNPDIIAHFNGLIKTFVINSLCKRA